MLQPRHEDDSSDWSQDGAEAASCILHCIGKLADRQPTMLPGDRVTLKSRHPLDNGTGEHRAKRSPDRASDVSVHRSVCDRARPLGTVTSGVGGIHQGFGNEIGSSCFCRDTQTRTHLPDTVSRQQDLPDNACDRNTASSKGEHASQPDCGWNNRGQYLARISDVDRDHQSRSLQMRGPSEAVQTCLFCQRGVARCRIQIEESPRSTGGARSSRAVIDSALEWMRVPHSEQAHDSKYRVAHHLASDFDHLEIRSQ